MRKSTHIRILHTIYYITMAASKTGARFVTATVAVQSPNNVVLGEVALGASSTAPGVALASAKGEKRRRTRVGALQPNVTLQVGGLAVVPTLKVPPEQAKRMRLCELTKRSGYASTFAPVGLGTAISPHQVLLHPSYGPAFGNQFSLNIKQHLTKTLLSATTPAVQIPKTFRAGGPPFVPTYSGAAARQRKFVTDISITPAKAILYKGVPDIIAQTTSHYDNNRTVSCWSFVQVPFDRNEAMRLERKSVGQYGPFWTAELTAALDAYAAASVSSKIVHKFSSRKGAKTNYKCISGNGVPAATIGTDGDFFYDLGGNFYGPKTGAVWGIATPGAKTADEIATAADEAACIAGTATPVMYPSDQELKNGTYASVVVVVNFDVVGAADNVRVAWENVAKLSGDFVQHAASPGLPAEWQTKVPWGYDGTGDASGAPYKKAPVNSKWVVAAGTEIGRLLSEECRASNSDSDWPTYLPNWSKDTANLASPLQKAYMAANYGHMLRGGPSTNALGGASYKPFAEFPSDARFLETGNKKAFTNFKVPPSLMHYDTQGPPSYRFSELDAEYGYSDGIHHEQLIAEAIWEKVRIEGRTYACTVPIREASYVQPGSGSVTQEVYRPATCYKVSGPTATDVGLDPTSLLSRTDAALKTKIQTDKLYYNFYGSVHYRAGSGPVDRKSHRFVACTAQDRAYAVFGAAAIEEVASDGIKKPLDANGYRSDWPHQGEFTEIDPEVYSDDRATGITAPYVNTPRQPASHNFDWAAVRSWDRYFDGVTNCRTVNTTKTYDPGGANPLDVTQYGETYAAQADNTVFEGWTPKVLNEAQRNILRCGENVLVAWPYEVPEKTPNSVTYPEQGGTKHYSALWFMVPAESCTAATSSGGISSLMSVFTPFQWCHKPVSIAIALQKN